MTPAAARARSSARRRAGTCLGCGEVEVTPGERCADCRSVRTSKQAATRYERAPRVTEATLFALVGRIEALAPSDAG